MHRLKQFNTSTVTWSNAYKRQNHCVFWEFSCRPGFFFSTAAVSDIRTHVLALLKRHSVVFGTYRWTEFDEEFLQKHVDCVVLADLGLIVMHQMCLFLNKYCLNPSSVFNLVLNSASRPGDLLTLCWYIHPEWGWTQHAHSGGGWGVDSSQPLVASSR